MNAPDREYDTAGAVDTPLLLGIQEGYQRWAPNYDHGLNPLIAREERYIKSLLLPLHGKKVLDLACGTGRCMEKALAAGAEFVAGVDCSDAMLRIASEKQSSHGRLAQADCMKLPFGTSAFDFVFCSFAIGHIQHLQPVARELAVVMKPGGEVLVTDVHFEAYARGWRTGFRDQHRPLQIEMFPHTAEQILRAFDSAGFECLTCAPLYLGEAEEPIFISANKRHAFEEACQVPAILVCHFNLRNPAQRELM